MSQGPIVYPSGETLTTSALTPAQMSIIWQNITCAALGITPVDPSLVRINWQTQGQPFNQLPNTQDICYLACQPEDVHYSKVRDLANAQPGSTLEKSWLYTKGWRISWVLYGPNAHPRAQLIWSAMFQDYFTDQLSLSNLYPVTDYDTPTRVPELVNAEWWERSDFSLTLYEQVTETLTTTAASSVEIKVYDNKGLVADITAPKGA